MSDVEKIVDILGDVILPGAVSQSPSGDDKLSLMELLVPTITVNDPGRIGLFARDFENDTVDPSPIPIIS